MKTEKILLNNGSEIAYRKTSASSKITTLYLHGMQAVMGGNKSETIKNWSLANNFSFIEMDYTGHGLSSGTLMDGSITTWLHEVEQIFLKLCPGKSFISASSMGCWIAVLLAEKFPESIAGMTLISPAIDLYRFFYLDNLSEAQRQTIHQQGFIEIFRPNYDVAPLIITSKMIQDCKNNAISEKKIDLQNIPVSISHSLTDTDISFHSALTLYKILNTNFKHLQLFSSGNHNMADENSLKIIISELNRVKKHSVI